MQRLVALGWVLAGLCLRAPAAEPGAAGSGGTLRVYVGTYTQRGSQGIYLAHLEQATGQLQLAGLAAEVTNPSFLAIHPNRRFLFAVGEVSKSAGGPGGTVSAFAIDAATGKLTLLNQKSSQGAGPCHVVVDPPGKNVLVANYGSGSAACLPVADSGQLRDATPKVQHEGSSVNPQRQKGPHAHSINLDAANRFAVVADLGLDKVMIYRFNAAAGTLTPNDPAFVKLAPGSGPRHFAFHPNGRFAYVINELNSTVTAFAYDARRGALQTVATVSTLPKGFSGSNTTAEVQVHPSGKFLYGSNRGHHSIAVFAIDANSGRLSPLGHTPTQGKTPRNFGIDPSGRWLLAANQDSDTVMVFRVDPKTGKPFPTGQGIHVPMPVCVKMAAPPSSQ